MNGLVSIATRSAIIVLPVIAMAYAVAPVSTVIAVVKGAKYLLDKQSK